MRGYAIATLIIALLLVTAIPVGITLTWISDSEDTSVTIKTSSQGYTLMTRSGEGTEENPYVYTPINGMTDMKPSVAYTLAQNLPAGKYHLRSNYITDDTVKLWSGGSIIADVDFSSSPDLLAVCEFDTDLESGQEVVIETT